MELRLVVQSPRRQRRVIGLEIPSSSTIGQLVDAVAAHLEDIAAPAEDWTARIERTGVFLRRTDSFSASGIRQGDLVTIGRAGTAAVGAGTESSARATLAVVGGPDLGRRFRLAQGQYRIGRDPGAEIALSDPSVSTNHAVLEVRPDGVALADQNSRNGSSIEGVVIRPGKAVPVPAAAVFQLGRTLLRVEDLDGAARNAPVVDGLIPFNRPPRRTRPYQAPTLSIAAPPADPPKQRLPMAAALVPLLFAGLLQVTNIGNMSSSSSGGGGALLLFAVLGPIMAVASFVEDRRSGRKDFGRAAAEWRAKLTAIGAIATSSRAEEVQARRAMSPDTATLLDRAALREPGLWERRPDDRDFLALRAGIADQPSLVAVDLADDGSPALRTEAQPATAQATVPAVPLLFAMPQLGVVGIAGGADKVDALARSLVLQAAVLHSPRHVLIAAVLGAERAGEWQWLRWLPHTRPEASPMPGPLVAAGADAPRLVERLLGVVAARKAEAKGGLLGPSDAASPVILVLLDEDAPVARPVLGRLMREGPEVGVLAVWLGHEVADMPGECRGIAELAPDLPSLTWTETPTHVVVRDAIPDGVAPDVADNLARTLSPLRDASADRGAAEIPRSVGLLDLLGSTAPDAAWVADRWQGPGADVAAPVGATAAGSWALDLLHDGPHGLVAGTTGSGKSELLQTLVVSLASSLPPSRLTFLLVDYKGGAAFKECVALPHTVGFVTDLDAHLTTRALVSLNAELKHREHVLASAGAKDLPSMLRIDPATAPPRLLIVVDEFATLAKEVPDFVDGLVDVAQRGRSLGVHMLLATQRPAGVVTPNIRANTNLRIALRVSDTGDSDDVIGVPDAARIPRDVPGRAFARIGHSDLVEFQAGYSGRRIAAPGDAPVIRVFALDLAGNEVRQPRRPGAAADEPASATELQVVVAAVQNAARDLALPPPRRPWLPSLPPVVELAALEGPLAAAAGEAAGAIALLDDPAVQEQRAHSFDLERDGSLLVFGAGGTGKTTVLRTIAAALSRTGEPVHLYGLDFGSRGLAPLEALPSCGSVIPGEQDERIQRLFAMLRREIARRKDLFGRAGVSGLAEFASRPDAEPLPGIVVFLDGYEGFAATYEKINYGELLDFMPRLVSDGRSTGIHLVITAERRGSVSTALFAAIPSRIVLRMADEDEYSYFGLPSRSLKDAKLPPGRGFVSGSFEVQVAVLGDDPSASGQARALAALGAAMTAKAPARVAPAIGILPLDIALSSLPIGEAGEAVIGTGDELLQPVSLNLADGHIVVAGPGRSGRSTALATIVEALRASTPSASFHLLAPRKTPLTDLTGWASATRGTEACDARLTDLADELAGVAEGDPPAVVVIDDGEELAETDSASILADLVAAGRERPVRLVVAVEARAAHRTYAEWLTRLRGDEQGILLDPDPDVDGDLLGARLPRGSGKPMPPGRGYVVAGGIASLAQVARSETGG